ncbi:hypothetical protein N481_25245 [Pseudoalteromonas luteoviolacea S4047-1]|uniref:Uncharacterized protein n=1 Tax=Pseudoalteromonas luteoviolacea S4054 TaxID=1129367 RepID=A0A0F6A9W7_9GAMM|nr:hypothetical protein N479_19090 [Pseudoalteromonas luteoviolacea S4054]KZN65464.1 hypothetical protein N481_25245 [Pseudoalteromonas luteoviolacea S4047-1]
MHPKTLGDEAVEQFLSHLANQQNVAAKEQVWGRHTFFALEQT